jgi:hypothetical protein
MSGTDAAAQRDMVERILRARVYDVARETPLQPAPRLSARLGSRVLLKREDLQAGMAAGSVVQASRKWPKKASGAPAIRASGRPGGWAMR